MGARFFCTCNSRFSAAVFVFCSSSMTNWLCSHLDVVESSVEFGEGFVQQVYQAQSQSQRLPVQFPLLVFVSHHPKCVYEVLRLKTQAQPMNAGTKQANCVHEVLGLNVQTLPVLGRRTFESYTTRIFIKPVHDERKKQNNLSIFPTSNHTMYHVSVLNSLP